MRMIALFAEVPPLGAAVAEHCEHQSAMEKERSHKIIIIHPPTVEENKIKLKD